MVKARNLGIGNRWDFSLRGWSGAVCGLLMMLGGGADLRAASDIQEATSASAGIAPTFDTGNFTITAVVDPLTLAYPGTITVGNYTGQADAYSLALTIPIDSFTFGSPGTTSEQMFQASSTSGSVAVTNDGSLTFNDAIAAIPGALGSAAIQAVAGALPFGSSEGTGGAVTVTNNGSITVHGSGSVQNFGTTLSPAGFYTAAVNGIVAASVGKQDNNPTNTHAGGDVTVTTGFDSNIEMTNSGADVVTAGISATSVSGPGTSNGVNAVPPTVTVNHSGTITNSADSGIGILATVTGAQFTVSGASDALGGNISISTGSYSAITATGQTGIGIFAVGEVYTASGDNSHDFSLAGNVDLTLGAGSTITAGTATSVFSAGALAVSSGTNLLLDPFGSHAVNGLGNGSGGAVFIESDSGVQTKGTMSVGLAGLSLGGGAIVTTNNGSGATYVGNSGGSSDSTGSSGGGVTIINGGVIQTLGTSAYGIVALSVPGGGLVNNLVAATGADSGLVVGNNTSGGPGAAGGIVQVTNDGWVTTGDGTGGGAASMGLLAQSIGGGGGNAGGEFAAIFLGDNAGSGGAGGATTVTLGASGKVVTKDINSLGILAQSIGGGGGNGANAHGLFVAVGGKGAGGGAGGAVTATINGSVETQADHSGGVVLQSVGGGGGNGGAATTYGSLFAIGVGGRGGGGGAGGTLTGTINSTGSIATVGNNSAGLIGQSIGGGGGTGGAAVTYTASILNINFGLGGNGGTGGDGGSATVTNAGVITTGVAPANGTTPGLPNGNGADSIGLLVQSIGGGGGHAGSALNRSFSFPTGEIPQANLSLAFGGDGGSAGAGGPVTAQNSGQITTLGDGSHGLVAQSIAMGGGNGGDATATAALLSLGMPSTTVDFAFGGKGGGAGNAGTVNVTTGGIAGTETSLPIPVAGSKIATSGQNAAGVVAQSIGGGGGNGGVGNAAGDPLAVPDSGDSFAVTIGLGGKGGTGGDGGVVNVTNLGAITTEGSGSQGILAQSIGAGGGNGGGGAASAAGNTLSLIANVGGNGAGGGNGGAVTVDNESTITTSGGDGTGILAQSIGGGGGNGGGSDTQATTGLVYTLATKLDPSTAYTGTLTIGGNGGAGAAGGAVQVTTVNSISTGGVRAYGVLAQSIAGGGGVAGAANASSNAALFNMTNADNAEYSATIALGGQGGESSNAGDVTVTNYGNVATTGYGATGIFAQSIAGGGGVGADGSIDTKSTIGLGIDIGGGKGESGSAGTVNVSLALGGANPLGLSTTGGDAIGIFAQAIGGGGGQGTSGSAVTGATNLATVLDFKTDITLGFNVDNSSATNGGVTQVSVTGAPVTTGGDWSHGILAQSIGGGGGKGSFISGTNAATNPELTVQVGAKKGEGWGAAATATLTNGTVTTTGYSAYGVVVQSIGGGGGVANANAPSTSGTISVGAIGGTGGSGTATLSSSGTSRVQTSGANAHGVILQSIGGGGGIAGAGSSQAQVGGGAIASLSGVTVGGTGKGSAGGVSIPTGTVLDIQTSGANAFALVAQSIGGGGGIAVANTTSAILGGAVSDTSDGGLVSLDLAAGSTITTTGAGAHGLVAQSIGGGGGILNPNASTGLNLLAPVNATTTQGNGGAVTLNLGAAITVSGQGAYGVVAQSISGGGGLIGASAGPTGAHGSSSSGSDTGKVTITVDGSITDNAASFLGGGIFAQSQAVGGAGNTVGVTLNGSVQSTNGTGVSVVAGDSGNLVTVSSGATLSGGAAAVSYSGDATLAVENYGTLAGGVLLSNNASADGSFTNEAGATFQSSTAVVATVTDGGTFEVGGAGALTTSIAGKYTQQSTGTLVFDLFNLATFDSIALTTGTKGTFDGHLTLNFSPSYVPQVGDTWTLITGSDNSYAADYMTPAILGLPAGTEVTIITSTGGFDGNLSAEISFVAVPEPAPSAVVFLVLATMIIAARRRKAC
jgi:hypothetical protein